MNGMNKSDKQLYYVTTLYYDAEKLHVRTPKTAEESYKYLKKLFFRRK